MAATAHTLAPAPHARPVGTLLRGWRERRRMSQLDLACAAQISTRHLSCLETGRAHPSREMLLRLAERLAVPLRERNQLLLAGGFAPMYRERALDDPALAPARQALQLVLNGHEPYPAIAVDRHWNLVAMNRAAPVLLEGAAPELLVPPVNVLRVALDPRGVAPRIVNLPEVRHHLLSRLEQQVIASGDETLGRLCAELQQLGQAHPPPTVDYGGVLVPLKLRSPAGELSFFSTLTVFGSPLDITLAELAVEAFFPADAFTAEVLRRTAASHG